MGSQVHFCSLVVCDQNISLCAAGELWLGCSLMATSTMSLVFQKLLWATSMLSRNTTSDQLGSCFCCSTSANSTIFSCLYLIFWLQSKLVLKKSKHCGYAYICYAGLPGMFDLYHLLQQIKKKKCIKCTFLIQHILEQNRIYMW